MTDLTFLNLIFPTFVALLGFPALLAALINIGKVFGWIPDGLAPRVVLYANLVALIAVGYFAFTGKIDILTAIDNQLGVAAAFLVTFTTFVAELGLAKGFNNALRGTPIIGYSHSAEIAKG